MVTKAVLKALLSLLDSSADEEFQARVSAEVKRLLLAYLEPVLDG